MRIFLSLFLLCATVQAQDFDGVSMVGTNIWPASGVFNDIDPLHYYTPEGWLLYGWGNLASEDQAEGGFYTSEVATNLTFTVQLPETLPAGSYRFQLKTINYDNGPGDSRINAVRFVLGGGSNAVLASMSDRDNNNSRWLPQGVNITSLYATNRMTMVFSNTGNINIHMFLTALYYTTNLNEDVDGNRNDLIVDYSWPETTSTNVAHTNNLLAYSSFEAGISPWRASVENKVDSVTNWVTYSDSQHGAAALKFPEAGTVYSPYFWVKPDNRYYTVSCYWKGSGSITVSTPTTPSEGFSNTVSQTLTLPSAGSWTRTNFSLALPDYPSGTPYRISLVGAAATLMDGIMVHEGTNLAPYKPMDGIELGWSNSVLSAVYYSGAGFNPSVVVHNSSGSNRTITVRYQFWNSWNKLESSGSFETTLADGAKSVTTVTLPPANGWFRAVVWAEGVSPQETALMKMVNPGTSQDDFVGTHNFGRNWQIAGMERLGISWTRAMSPQAVFRVGLVEPTEGNFNWDDTSIANTVSHNTKILGTIGTSGGGVGWPEFMAPGGVISALIPAKWSNHVFAVVSHYAPLGVNAWEVGNEVDNGTIAATASEYYTMLHIASLAARAADPTCEIVGIGGSANSTFVADVLDLFGEDLTDEVSGFSIHSYTSFADDPYSTQAALPAARGWKAFADLYSPLPILNTESGANDYDGYQAFSGYPQVGGGIYQYQNNSVFYISLNVAPVAIANHTLAFKAYGFERFFNYDSRNQTDWAVRHYMTWHGDDTHRPKAALMATVNQVVAGTTGAGEFFPTSNSNVVFLYYENGNDSVAAAWSTNDTYYVLTQTNTVAYDHFNNAISGTSFVVGRMPVYIRPNGLTSAQFQTALTNCGVVSITDTNPPGLSIHTFPGTHIRDREVLRVRWSTVDEYSLPSVYQQEVLQTRSKLSTDSDYDNWSTATERIWTDVNPNVTLTVQAKDAAGNIATQTIEFGAATRTITFGGSGSGAITIGGSGGSIIIR